MAKITRVYTRTGDSGQTSLGGGQRVAKDDPRIEAFGDVDELNSCLGAARAAGLDAELDAMVGVIQNDLFHLGSDLCILEPDKQRLAVPRIEQRHVDALERDLDRLTDEVGPLENFILPGGTAGAAGLHVARAVCRRAERRLVQLAAGQEIGPCTVCYLNRLSDLLFEMARAENRRRGCSDVLWDSRA